MKKRISIFLLLTHFIHVCVAEQRPMSAHKAALLHHHLEHLEATSTPLGGAQTIVTRSQRPQQKQVDSLEEFFADTPSSSHLSFAALPEDIQVAFSRLLWYCNTDRHNLIGRTYVTKEGVELWQAYICQGTIYCSRASSSSLDT